MTVYGGMHSGKSSFDQKIPNSICVKCPNCQKTSYLYKLNVIEESIIGKYGAIKYLCCKCKEYFMFSYDRYGSYTYNESGDFEIIEEYGISVKVGM